MPAADTARLIATLELGKNTLGPGVDNATKSIGKLEGSLGRIGGIAQSGVKSAIGNVAKLGAVAAVGIGAAIKTGLDDLKALESATTAVDGAIKATGATGKVTSKEIATWANDIERDVGAAFDDKDIVQATATLLRFGKVTPGNVRPAMQIITDLAVKTGDVDSAATLLAKALADPEKAAGKLARTGVILTKAQQDQIKALTKAGDAAGAQKVILDSLAETTKGAAAASQGPYARAISVLADVSEDARKALAEGFLPVIEKVADMLSTQLANPKVIDDIRTFGQGLAKSLDSLIGVATKLPWQQIGDSFKLAGAGAKAVLDAFTQLPPWVQTAVLTGWGLNKLTGGALTGIVGELGKGLVKGVLGMNAGVVNIKAGVVNGGGGVGAGAGGAAGAAKGGLSGIAKVALVSEAIGLALLVNEVRVGLGNQATEQAAAINDTATRWINNNNVTSEQLRSGIDAVNTGISELQSNPLLTLVQGDALTELQETKRLLQEQLTVLTNPPDTAHDSDKELGSAADALRIAAEAMKTVNADAAHFKGQQTAFETRDRELPPDITKVPIKLPDYAHDLDKLSDISTKQSEMRTEFIADRQANQTGNVILGRAHSAIQTLTSTTSIVTTNVQAAVQSATAIAHNDAANLVAAVRAISVAPPTINVPRAPTPVVNVNISNRSVTSAVSRNTTFTRPV